MVADILLELYRILKCRVECGRSFLTFIIYMTILCDNVLLTVIVPILPDFLSQLNEQHSKLESYDGLQNSLKYKNLYLQYVSNIIGDRSGHNDNIDENAIANQTNIFTETNATENAAYNVISNKMVNAIQLNEENGSVGILLAVKALVQLIATPFVTKFINRFGYRLPTVCGTFCLCVASFVFAIGNSYFLLFFARALHGIASACIGVCGMSIVAQAYPDEKKRSQMLGIVLGSMALGVLIGYPFGGFMYAFFGKSTPFTLLAIAILILFVVQLFNIDLNCYKSEATIKCANYSLFLSDTMIVQIAGAIFVSTTAMAILEPCLPIWLMATLNPEKWQIGTVFIPDSVGYFISTNFFAVIAHKCGQIRTAVISLFIVGISCLLIPQANSVASLLLPHFFLGIGIGTLDVALVPLLASIVDTKYNNDDETSSGFGESSYGTIYAIQQMSVCLAYSLGPMIGGEIAQHIGFIWLMVFIGLTNLFYGIFLYSFVLGLFYIRNQSTAVGNSIILNVWPSTSIAPNSTGDYKRFYNTVDLP